VGDEWAIEAEGLQKRFGDVEALRGVDLQAERGTVLGLLGPNGAGKTTAVRILTTLLQPDGGSARVAGFDVVRQAARVRAQIGLAGQYAAVDENLSGFENLELVGRLYHLGRGPSRARADELLEEFGLAEAGKRLVRTYSGGMRRRLDLAAALVARPPILFLDEPTTGLDIRSRLTLWESIESLTARGTTVLLTTQYLEEADRLADRIAVVNHGIVIAQGTPEELKRQVGGHRLEIQLVDGSLAAEAVEALAAIGAGPPVAFDGTVSLPIEGAAGAVTAAVRRLDEAGIAIGDIATHEPTLDDVFLTLTGQTAGEDAEEEARA
jgi:ABC-2 type transport system ATP-binding protein